MKPLPLLALALVMLPAVAGSLVESPVPAPPRPEVPLVDGQPPMCPPRDRNDTYLVLYCATMYGIPKAVDRYYDNMTQGVVTANETIEQTRLLVVRVKSCLDGRYPPCPRMQGGIF